MIIPFTLINGYEVLATEKANINNKIKSIETQDYEIQSNRYILGPGDLISINIIGSGELSKNYFILNDGSISIPFIGRVVLEGLTLDQANIELQKLLESEFIDPQAYIDVVSPRPLKISILGEVKLPGLYTMNIEKKENISDKIPTLVDAIELSGGLNKNADIRNIIIKRKIGGKVTSYKTAKLNLEELILRGDQSQNPFLFDGDSIEVMKSINEKKVGFQIPKSNITVRKKSIYVIGEVKNPGILSIEDDTSVVQAILMAGGPTAWRTNKGNIDLIRVNKNGEVENQKIKIDVNNNITSKKNPEVISGDIILVNRTNLAKTSDAISETTKPISGIISAFTLLKLLE